MLKYSVAKSSGSQHDPPRHGKTRHDMNQNKVFRGMRGAVRRLHTGDTRGSLAKSHGLTATEDDIQLLVRHVVLHVWVGGRRRCWIATSEEKGILLS